MTSGLAGPSPLGLSQSWAWPVFFTSWQLDSMRWSLTWDGRVFAKEDL